MKNPSIAAFLFTVIGASSLSAMDAISMWWVVREKERRRVERRWKRSDGMNVYHRVLGL